MRTAANSLLLYMNGSPIPAQTSPAAASTTVDYNLWLFEDNHSGSPHGYNWTGKLQGFAMGTSALSGSQYATLHNAFVALNTALAR